MTGMEWKCWVELDSLWSREFSATWFKWIQVCELVSVQMRIPKPGTKRLDSTDLLDLNGQKGRKREERIAPGKGNLGQFHSIPPEPRWMDPENAFIHFLYPQGPSHSAATKLAKQSTDQKPPTIIIKLSSPRKDVVRLLIVAEWKRKGTTSKRKEEKPQTFRPKTFQRTFFCCCCFCFEMIKLLERSVFFFFFLVCSRNPFKFKFAF